MRLLLSPSEDPIEGLHEAQTHRVIVIILVDKVLGIGGQQLCPQLLVSTELVTQDTLPKAQRDPPS